MKNFLTAAALFAFALTATAQEDDNALLNSLTENCPFGQNAAAGNWGNLGDVSGFITLRGIICCGNIWYFSIYNAQTNSCSWLALKDAENLLPYKAEFFDDENNTLLLAANGKSIELQLKEQDPFTAPLPNMVAGTARARRGGNSFQRALSRMSTEQKMSMALQLATDMMRQNQNGQNRQQRQNRQSRQRRSR